MPQQIKEFKLRLPLPLYESFYRMFPRRGERQLILQRLVLTITENEDKYRKLFTEILEGIKV